MSLEQEISSQINESEDSSEVETGGKAGVGQPVLPVSGVFNSVFLFLSKDWDEEDREKLILDDMESQNLNEMLTPIIIRVAEKLGLAVEEVSAIIALTGLILPRIFLYVSLRRKYSKKGGENESK